MIKTTEAIVTIKKIVKVEFNDDNKTNIKDQAREAIECEVIGDLDLTQDELDIEDIVIY